MPWEVSRGRSTAQRAGARNRRVNEDTGRLDVGKGRTDRLASDHGKDIGTDDTRMGEETDERRSVGKHGVPGVWSSDHAVRWEETLIAGRDAP